MGGGGGGETIVHCFLNSNYCFYCSFYYFLENFRGAKVVYCTWLQYLVQKCTRISVMSIKKKCRENAGF